MLGEIHTLEHDFPAHKSEIHQLIANDDRFAEDNNRYNALDKQIRELELADSPISDEAMHQLKHQRSELKDSLYQRLVNP